MNILTILFGLVIFGFFAGLSINYDSQPEKNNTPKIQSFPSAELIHTNIRIANLFAIAQALEAYKNKYGAYPLGSENPKWSGYIDPLGNENMNWIVNLSPEFLPMLPRDPRHSKVADEQYYYVSNGANYKLYASNPEDCTIVQSIAPTLIVPVDNCIGYGLWTNDAGHPPYWYW